MSSARPETPLLGALRYRSIRFRLTALFVAIFGVVLIVFCSVLYSAFTRSRQNDFDADLYNHAVDVSRNITVGFFGNIQVSPEVLNDTGKIFPFSVGKIFLQVIDPQGKVVARSATLDRGSLPFYESDAKLLSRSGAVFRTLDPSEIPATVKVRSSYRVINYLIRSGFEQAYVLQIAVPMTFLEQSFSGLLTFLEVSIPLSLVLAAFGGLYLSRRALAPVGAIIETAKRLSASKLSDRLPIPEIDDELKQLTVTLNSLFDRLEQAFRSQERFIADASHELKTPLAIVRGELDMLRSRPRDPVETSVFLDSATQELDYLSRIVEDLLLLARMDAGAASLVLHPVRLDEISIETVSRLEVLAKARRIGIRFDLHGNDFEASGDADLLRSLLKNLIENAIKFSPEGGTVEVLLEALDDQVEIRVRDQGPGIPPELQGRIFERFYRITSGPGGANAPGAGLGLTIAKRIVEAHHGSIRVESPPDGGSRFIAAIARAH